LAANDQEIADHEKLLADLDKVSKGKTVWRMMSEI
jgi:DNA polymerase-3 subunit epsilon